MDHVATLEKTAQTVARRVSPSVQDAKEEKKFAQGLIEKLQSRLKDARLVLVGSTARDTGLHGDKDIDVFACFSPEMDEDVIVKKTISAVKKAIPAKWEMHYAEHPYLQAIVGAYRVEVIPCFEAQPHQGIKSAVDRSPLHMDFLQQSLNASQRQDVRALKVLLKNHRLYGAESYVRGFSGILCEYLILHFGSFARLVFSAAKWKAPVRIELVPSNATFEAPLIVIDAVDKNRNVAAVVSSTQLNRFIALCQALCQNPKSERLFQKNAKSKTLNEIQRQLKTRQTAWFLVCMKTPRGVEDVLLPQLEKAAKSLERHAHIEGFRPVSVAANADEKTAWMLLELESEKPAPVRSLRGPPVFQAKAVAQFLKGKKNVLRGPFVLDDHWQVEQGPRWKTAKVWLESMQKNPARLGIPSHWVKPFKQSKILAEKLPKLSKSNLQQLSEHVFRKETWF